MHHFTCIFMTPPLPCLWRSTSSTSLSNAHCSPPCRVAGSLLHSFSRVLRWLPWELLRFSSSFLERILVAVTAAGIGSGWTRTAEWWILTTSLSVIGLYLRRRLLPFAGPVLRSSRHGVFRSLFHFHCSSGSSEVDDVWFGTLWIKKKLDFLDYFKSGSFRCGSKYSNTFYGGIVGRMWYVNHKGIVVWLQFQLIRCLNTVKLYRALCSKRVLVALYRHFSDWEIYAHHWQVIADFDETLTRYKVDGILGQSKSQKVLSLLPREMKNAVRERAWTFDNPFFFNLFLLCSPWAFIFLTFSSWWLLILLLGSCGLLRTGNPEYDAKRRQLYEYYHRFEFSSTIPIDKKIKLMEER